MQDQIQPMSYKGKTHMKKYRYEDGFTRIIEDGYITPTQLHSDEQKHGELIVLYDKNKIITPDLRNEKRGLIHGKTRVM